MKLAKFALLCLALGASSQSYAAKIFTVTNTITPDSSGNASYDSVYDIGGSYRNIGSPYRRSGGLTFQFSAPVTGTISGYSYGTYSIRNRQTHIEIDANDMDFTYDTSLNNQRIGRVNFFDTFPFANWNGCGRYECSIHLPNLFAHIDLTKMNAPVSMKVTEFAGVPEPATWSLMILGFGAIGAMMRRRGKVSTGSREWLELTTYLTFHYAGKVSG